MEILDGRKVSGDILSELKTRVDALKSIGINPKLTAFNAGDHKPSKVYLAAKGKRAAEAGIAFELIEFAAGADAEVIISRLRQVNSSDTSGIIFQLPMPPDLREKQQEILNEIAVGKDVDLLTDEGRELLESGRPLFTPPTAGAVLAILDSYNIDLSEHNILLVGRGELVGKPLSHLLNMRGLAYQVVHSQTPGPEVDELLSWATLIITATGKPGIITADRIKEGVIIVDAGTAESAGKVVGDVGAEALRKAKYATPVPGGVGPVTVAMLLKNVVEAAEKGSVDS